MGPDVDLQTPPIHALACMLAKKCGGLPLALITVGRSMADARSLEEWEDAVHNLEETPQQLRNMQAEVLSPLKFSFDRLGDENAKNCLLYCSLFPEDYEIKVDELIEYWVGEGFLYTAKCESVVRARKREHDVLTRLVSACMLESVPVIVRRHGVSIILSKYRVKMHDVVHEMCVWLTGGEFDESNTYLS